MDEQVQTEVKENVENVENNVQGLDLHLTIDEANALLAVINFAAKSAGVEVVQITSYCLHFHKMLVDVSEALKKDNVQK